MQEDRHTHGRQAPAATPAARRDDHAPGWSDWSLPAVAAGFLAVLVSFSGPLAIFVRAPRAGHIPQDLFASWVWGTCRILHGPFARSGGAST